MNNSTKNKKIRILSLILTMALVITMVPMNVFATEVANESDSIEQPVAISEERSVEGSLNLEGLKLFKGTTYVSCAKCDYSTYEEIPTLGHDYSEEWTEDKAATCTEEGSKSRHCSRCDATTDVISIEALGHDYSEDWIIDKTPTCAEAGSKSHHCNRCGDKNNITVIKATGKHEFKRNVITPATNKRNGLAQYVCNTCGKIDSTETIYRIASYELSEHNFNYDGSPKTPTVIIKDSKGHQLIQGKDFTLTFDSLDRRNMGWYHVWPTFQGDYSGAGWGVTLCFEIGPQNPSSVSTKLYGHDDIKISWKKVSGASGYIVYYKKSTANSWSSKTTTGTSLKIANLSDGVKYDIKVASYLIKNKKRYVGAGKTTSIYTAKNLSAPSKVTTALYGYDDVKLSWSKVSGAKGYKVYCKRTNAKSYSYIGFTTGTSVKKANLADGKKYYFKIVPCTKVNGSYFADDSYKKASVTTLKKVSTPKVVKSASSKVKVSWTNISGETGYQISKSTSKTGTNIVTTYKTTSGKSKNISATKGKNYYYKVRAYKVVSGKKIYGPWSSVVKYKKK